ncbi:MAG: hypothetical protein WDW38_003143 [Sanguina aurantia]
MFSAVLTADPGDFSGQSEAHHIVSNLKGMRVLPRNGTVCADLYHGELMGQFTVVAITGIGPVIAGLCTWELVNKCGPLIRDLVYFGTSGWTPQKGVLNPPQCKAANGYGEIIRIGDACVSPFTVNGNCKKSNWRGQSKGYPNQCFRPEEASGPNATYLYGQCQFYADNIRANLQLSNEITRSATSARARASYPTRSKVVLRQEALYWELMGEGTRVRYPEITDEGSPTVWDHTECMEVDGQFFWTDVPYEVKARDYVAEAINSAMELSGEDRVGPG